MLVIRGKGCTPNLSEFENRGYRFWGILLTDTADFFRSRLDGMVDHKHPLVVLSKRLPWA
jgi:hypothetical protein